MLPRYALHEIQPEHCNTLVTVFIACGLGGQKGMPEHFTRSPGPGEDSIKKRGSL